MTTRFDVPADAKIDRVSKELKKSGAVTPPQWAGFVKTGMHKERPPKDQDWWYVRAASVLRKVALLGPIGVSKLRRKYGGKKNNGVAPEHTYKGSGNIVRKIFQQLEASDLIQKSKTAKAGRILSPKGKSLLDKASAGIVKETTSKKKAAPAKKQKVEAEDKS